MSRKHKKKRVKKHKAARNKSSSKNSKEGLPKGNFIVGVDIGGTFVKAGLVKLDKNNAKIIKHSKRLVEAQVGKDASLSNILLTIEEVMPQGKDRKRVKAIGVGFPAPVDEKGLVHEITNMKEWEGVSIKKEIEKKFKIKTFVDNDANCFVLGEAAYGAAKGKKNVVGVTLGTGVGGGIIIDGKLYRGNTNAAGEFGKSPYKDRMLEQSINISALRFMSLMDSIDLKKKTDAGDDFSKYILTEYGKELGNILSIIVDFYDPEMIVLGGGLSNFFRAFEKPMNEELEKKVFRRTFRKLKVVRAKLEQAGVIGAALLAAGKY